MSMWTSVTITFPNGEEIASLESMVGLWNASVDRDHGLQISESAREERGLAYAIEAWRLKLTADFLYRDSDSGSLKERSVPSVGLEKSLEGDRVKFRLGASPDQLSAGGGVQFDRFGFDYAFILSRNLLAHNAGTHMIGIRYRFGDSAPASPRNP